MNAVMGIARAGGSRIVFPIQRRGGFTLVEMLVVIGILGILSVALLSSFGHVKNSARKAQAQSLVSEAATAFTRYLQNERSWPAEFLIKQEMDEEVCRVFQKKKYLDVTPYKIRRVDDVTSEVTNERNMKSLDRFGLLDPWGQAALKKNPTQTVSEKINGGRSFADHRLQYRIDKNYDGFVDSQDGEVPKGVRVRASVLVWSRGPDGLDDFNGNGRYPRDDSLSWSHAQYEADK